MVSAANTAVFQKEWFNYTGGYGIPKAEFQNQVSAFFADLERKSIQNYSDLTERVKERGTNVDLTEEQTQYLAENFNPENMSLLDYQSFIDKLCEFGVLDEADKPYVGYGAAGCGLDMTPLEYVRCGARLTPANQYNPMSYDRTFSSSRGNIPGWSKYLSSTTVWDQTSGSWQKTPEAVLFSKIHSVLEEISL